MKVENWRLRPLLQRLKELDPGNFHSVDINQLGPQIIRQHVNGQWLPNLQQHVVGNFPLRVKALSKLQVCAD
jgi:hypothetical protein